ncbi:MAG: Holliday junction resolvase RuvX [Acidobacteria bacterium]|nr:Holliday junction resolvase RuvX [Acidobacteriota bacterium]
MATSTLGRILGLDYGEKRIGLAISDPLRLTAQGLPTLERRSLEEDLRAIRDLIRANEVVGIVIGMPRRMDGTLGEQARRVQRFAEHLRRETGLPVEDWDERLTTVAAERALLEGSVRRRDRRHLRDRIAAVLILQGYLDRLAAGGGQEEGG